MMLTSDKKILLTLLLLGGCAATTPPEMVPGPDKQFSSGFQGAVEGAGAGAVTGFQVGAGTGPGAFVGAGFGAIAGGIHGIAEDKSEEQMLKLSANTRREREIAQVHEILNEHYKRRLELHPTRDIFPADLFFPGDSSKLSFTGDRIIRELSKMNKNRLPWSRLVVASYVKANDEKSAYAEHLATERAISIGNGFVKYGIEPRRIETRAMIVNAPVLIDPKDNPSRYNQAIELIPADR